MLHSVGSSGSGPAACPAFGGTHRSWCQLLTQGHFVLLFSSALTMGHSQRGTQGFSWVGSCFKLLCVSYLHANRSPIYSQGASHVPSSPLESLLPSQPLPGCVLFSWPATCSEAESVPSFLCLALVRQQRRWWMLLWGQPGCPRLPAPAQALLWWCSGHSGTCRETCLPVGPACPACCLLPWKSCFSCESPELSTLCMNKPSAVSFGGFEIHNYCPALPLLCGGCAVAEWIKPSKGKERKRQLECSKCFAHQLPPILHPERLKAVCLQLCVMSCSVCHLMSSPGITRQA